jgi:glyoxylase-like metal-dependent hydrolase (beta-lactamase superfamily II)
MSRLVSMRRAQALRFARVASAAVLALAARTPLPAQAPVAAPLAPWTRGTLDIHQLSTGRGNAALVVLPDGTTLLVDAGPGGDIIAGYVERALRPVEAASGATAADRRQPPRLDYALLTHFHSDHAGGLAELGSHLTIDTILDRGFDYLTPPSNDATFSAYRAFVAAAEQRGARRAAVRVGAADQIVARRDRAAFPTLEIRVVAANGEVWTGRGDATTRIFPALDTLAPDDRPSENMCSVGLRLRYGRFGFFTGGDMPGVPDAGAPAWQSVETAVARAIGPTDVHVVNHHGSIDPESEFFLRTLRSTVLILPAWSVTHPSQDVLKRMLAPRLYPGTRDIFATLIHQATKDSIGTRAGQLAADHGHIVVRVEPGGDRYRVFVLDETSASAPVLSTHGPYPSF